AASVNQMLPSGPAVICNGSLLTLKPGVSPDVNSVTVPFGLSRATRPGSADSVNQILEPGPAVIPKGEPFAEKAGVTPPVNSVTFVSESTRATRPGSVASVNQILPSGPRVIDSGLLPVKPSVVPLISSVLT